VSSFHESPEETDSEAEAGRFVPPTTQAWEYPLSKSEKRLLHVRLCDLERAAAVQEMKEKDAKYKNLKRRVSTGRVSIGRPAPATPSDSGSECLSDDEDGEYQKLTMEKRELEERLKEVTEKRRLSLSEKRRLSLSKA